MQTNPKQLLEAIDQAAVADEIVTALIAVISDTAAPESALDSLGKQQDAVPEERRAAVAALHAYGVARAAPVLVAGLEPDARARVAQFSEGIEAGSDDAVRSLLGAQPDEAAEFKSRLSLDVAARCAEMLAAEIDRAKGGHFAILDEKDAQEFEARRERHRNERIEAAREFLASLPRDYPGFGARLFADIRRVVQGRIEDQHKRPDAHAAVSTLFDDALHAMPESLREAVRRSERSAP